jgi:hypothetical protein
MPVAGSAFLLYFSPKSVGERGACAFHVQAIRLDVDPARARETFRRAVAALREGAPPAGPACEYCLYLKKGASVGL